MSASAYDWEATDREPSNRELGYPEGNEVGIATVDDEIPGHGNDQTVIFYVDVDDDPNMKKTIAIAKEDVVILDRES